jgi:hypothetical protein
MKKISSFFAVIVTLTFAACGPKDDGSGNSGVPQGMMALDLSQYGYNVSINVPDSSVGPLEVVQQSWGAVEIKVGKAFQVSVKDGQGDIPLKKSDIAGNDVNKFKRYVVDEPNALLWESQIMEPEFHFYAVVKAGDASYEVEDIAGEIFSEAAATKMLESAKAMKAVEKKKENS